MKTIITIQHTESIHHTNGMVGSWTDWDLSELGKEQAHRIGKKMVKEFQGWKFVMYSSDLKRAKQTAEIAGTVRSNFDVHRLCNSFISWFVEADSSSS